MHYCYILYSPKIDHYYVGESDNSESRLEEHNNGHYKGAFTIQTSDWKIYLQIPCKDRIEARKIERFIKKQKSRKFIEKLMENPKIIEDIKNK